MDQQLRPSPKRCGWATDKDRPSRLPIWITLLVTHKACMNLSGVGTKAPVDGVHGKVTMESHGVMQIQVRQINMHYSIHIGFQLDK